MIVSKINPLKAVLYPEKGGGDKRPNIKDNSILLWKGNSFYKKKSKNTITNYFKEGIKVRQKMG